MHTTKEYTRRNLNSFDWKDYFKYDDIVNWLLDLTKTYPMQTELFSIGTTYEKRSIMAFKVALNREEAKQIVIIEGGIHAREWISSAVVTYLINGLLTAYKSNDVSLLKVAESYEFYFVPVLNPDGYEYSHNVVKLF